MIGSVALFLLAAVARGDCVDIPFRWTPGQIEIRVSVNGREPVWFILDSGSEYSVLDADLTRDLGIPTRSRYGRDFAGDLDLMIGDVALRKQNVMVLPLANFKAQHRPIQGIVGYDFFERRVVVIDYDKSSISACEPRSFRASRKAVRIPMRFAGRLPVIGVAVTIGDGTRLPLRAMVDTGAQAAMILRHPFADAHGLLKESSPMPDAPSVQGPLPMTRIAARDIIIGQWKVTTTAVAAHAAPVGSGGFTDTDALIGNELLRHFRVTFDYPRQRILLER